MRAPEGRRNNLWGSLRDVHEVRKRRTFYVRRTDPLGEWRTAAKFEKGSGQRYSVLGTVPSRGRRRKGRQHK